MSRKVYKAVHLCAYLTLIHGTIYGAVKYLMQVETEYGIRPHPQQDVWLSMHVLLSPLLVFAFGMLWQNHIVKMYINAIIKRKSGISLVVIMFLMIITGYLTQIIYQADWQNLTGISHAVIGLIFGLIYLIHHFLGRRS